MPHLNKLYQKFKKNGLVVLGIHTTRGGEKMPDFVKKAGVTYPVAVDVKGGTVAAYHVDSFPDYYVIDRSGKLRFADLANQELDRAVRMLLLEKPRVEKPRPDARQVLRDAMARAVKEDKRLLVHLGAPW